MPHIKKQINNITKPSYNLGTEHKLIELQKLYKPYGSFLSRNTDNEKLDDYASLICLYVINDIMPEVLKLNDTKFTKANISNELEAIYPLDINVADKISQACSASDKLSITISYLAKYTELNNAFNLMKEKTTQKFIAQGKLLPLLISDSYNIEPFSSYPLQVSGEKKGQIKHYIESQQKKLGYVISELSYNEDLNYKGFRVGTLAKIRGFEDGMDELNIHCTPEKIVKINNIVQFKGVWYAKAKPVICFIHKDDTEENIRALIEQNAELIKKLFRNEGLYSGYLPETNLKTLNFKKFVEHISILLIQKLHNYLNPSKSISLITEPDLGKRLRLMQNELLKLLGNYNEDRTAAILPQHLMNKVRKVNKISAGYIPIIICHDIGNLLSLSPFNNIINPLWKDYSVARDLIIDFFYRHKKDIIIIGGDLSNYSFDTPSPSILAQMNNFELGVNNTFFLNIIPQKRIILSKMVLYKGVLYGKPETFDENYSNSDDERIELEALVDQSLELNKLVCASSKVLSFNSANISFETYAANLSFYLITNNEILYKEKNSIEGISSLESFCKLGLCNKFEKINEALSNKLKRKKQWEEEWKAKYDIKPDLNSQEIGKNNFLANILNYPPLTAASSNEDFKLRITELPIGSLVKEKAEIEFSKLGLDNNMAQTEIRNYLSQLLNLFSLKESETPTDFKNSLATLDKNHYGHNDVKNRITEFLAVAAHTGSSNNNALCLLGPPGVGKSSLAESIANAMGRKFVRLALGGISDISVIKGHMRAYTSSTPGMIIQLIQQSGTSNPIIFLDEIDKVSTTPGNNAVLNALLELLDNKHNKFFTDQFFQIPFDLSKVMFIVAANETDNLPAPLLDRLEIIRLNRYSDLEKLKISKLHIIPRLIKEYRLDDYEIEFSDDLVLNIIRLYTREAGVRSLENNIRIIMRKLVTRIVMNDFNDKTLFIDKNLVQYLGPPQIDDADKVVYLDEVRS